jgi:hypothetical protein
VTTVASANLGNRSDDDVFQGLVELSKYTDVIGVQEAGDRGRVLARFVAATGWMVFHGVGEGAPSVAVLWNPQQVIGTHPSTRPCTPATDCGSCGAGPDRVKAKVWNKVRINPRNGDSPFVFINGHLPASLYCKCRKRLAKDMITELVDMFVRREDKIDVVAVMDGNSLSSNPIWRPLKKAGAKQWTRFPTHGLRAIDLTWTLGRKAKARAFKKKFSDHRWVILHLL